MQEGGTFRMPQPRSRARIEELARDMLRGTVVDWFTMVADGNGNLITTVFMPLGMGCLADCPSEQIAQLAVFAVVGKHRDCGRRWRLAGYPLFATCEIWRLDDYVRAVRLYAEAETAVNAAMQQSVDV